MFTKKLQERRRRNLPKLVNSPEIKLRYAEIQARNVSKEQSISVQITEEDKYSKGIPITPTYEVMGSL